MHKFHSCRDHLRAPLSHLVFDEVQLIEDLNSARAKLGTAANLHYVRSGREGTPTLLSKSHIAYLLQKKEAAKKGSGHETIPMEQGPIDDIFMYLEETGNYYVSLLARGPNETTPTTETTPKSTLFNETRIGMYTAHQEDFPVTGQDDTQMLRTVDDHRCELNIDDSKEMMVGIAYGKSFELDQFGLFQASMHIDATADSNNEGCPLVTVTSKDSFGHMFFVLRAFLPSEQS
jgi:hypothetical protein